MTMKNDMQFGEFKVLFQNNFKELVKDASHLFQVELNLENLWEIYLSSFPLGTLQTA